MKVLLHVQGFLLPLTPGYVQHFLEHFKGPAVALGLEFAGPRGAELCYSHSAVEQRENGPAWQNGLPLRAVTRRHAGASVSPLGWLRTRSCPFPADSWASIHVNVAAFIYPCGYTGIVTHSQPQPALQSRYVNVVWGILLLFWKLRFHPTLPQAWPAGSAQPRLCWPAGQESGLRPR